MNLYAINQKYFDILNMTDEDGCLSEDAFAALAEIKGEEIQKIENVALYIKDTEGFAAAIRNEEKALAERRKVYENKAERLRKYLSDYLLAKEEPKFETQRVALSFRRSEKVNIFDEQAIIAEHPELTSTEIKVKAADVKAAIKSGQTIPGAEIVENQNLQIK